jgi:hypothetical protein
LTIIDDNKTIIKKHFGLDREEEYDIVTLWTLGTYFLKYAPKMKVARFFPMLGFIAPEEDTGKSTALNTVARLSHNPMSRGKKTIPSILDKIHKTPYMTVPLDELHKKLGKSDDFDDFFNLGYEWDATVERKNREGEGQKETFTFCPKPFAAMSLNEIASDTASRCLMIYLYPRTDYQGYMDVEALAVQNEKNQEWADRVDTVDGLESVVLAEEDMAFMHNRKRQILALMLAIAKITNDEWYQKGLKAVKQFVAEEDRERSMGHKIILALYRIKELKLYGFDGDDTYFWTTPIMYVLRENGIPEYIKDTTVAKILKGYDPKIKSTQIKKNRRNLNGYYWSMFDKAFKFITAKERAEIEAEKNMSTSSTLSTPIDYSTLSDDTTMSTNNNNDYIINIDGRQVRLNEEYFNTA